MRPNLRSSALTTSVAALWLACGLAQASRPAKGRTLAELSATERMQVLGHLPDDQRQLTARAARADMARRGVDTTGPVITALDITTPEVNAQVSPNRVQFTLSATDDQVGVLSYYLRLTGPSGQALWLYNDSFVPHRSVAGTGGNRIGVAVEAGAWTVTLACAVDLNGNTGCYDTAALAGFPGNKTLQVRNGRHDSALPSLTHGKVLTPTLSNSRAVAGSTRLKYGGVTVRFDDAGGARVVAGVANATLAFCKDGKNSGSCMWFNGSSNAMGDRTTTISASAARGDVGSPRLETGVYLLTYMSIADFAGNYRSYLSSTDPDGDIDFGAYFPDGTAITITP